MRDKKALRIVVTRPIPKPKNIGANLAKFPLSLLRKYHLTRSWLYRPSLVLHRRHFERKRSHSNLYLSQFPQFYYNDNFRFFPEIAFAVRPISAAPALPSQLKTVLAKSFENRFADLPDWSAAPRFSIHLQARNRLVTSASRPRGKSFSYPISNTTLGQFFSRFIFGSRENRSAIAGHAFGEMANRIVAHPARQIVAPMMPVFAQKRLSSQKTPGLFKTIFDNIPTSLTLQLKTIPNLTGELKKMLMKIAYSENRQSIDGSVTATPGTVSEHIDSLHPHNFPAEMKHATPVVAGRAEANMEPTAMPVQHQNSSSPQGTSAFSSPHASPPAPSIDLADLTNRVYDEFERKLRMEKERRGL